MLEASAMLLVQSDLVDMGRAPMDGPTKVPLYDRYPNPAGYILPSGVLARAERSPVNNWQLLLDD